MPVLQQHGPGLTSDEDEGMAQQADAVSRQRVVSSSGSSPRCTWFDLLALLPHSHKLLGKHLWHATAAGSAVNN
jgi:hypothetical protein